jgi:hypothetical protein
VASWRSLRTHLATWAGDATELTATELQGLAELQSEFVTDQLRKVLPAGSRDAVRTVEISPQFAQSRLLPLTRRNSMWWHYRMTYLKLHGCISAQAGSWRSALTAAKGATMITLAQW